MNEIREYMHKQNVPDNIINWADKRFDDKQDLSEQEHIIDYLVADCPPKLEKMRYDEVKKKAEAWTNKLIKQANEIIESPTDTELVLDFKDGFKFVKIIGENAYKREGNLMRHCVGSYANKGEDIYSLRDKDNMPHCTISKQSEQIKGKGNGSINPKYIKYVVEFLEHLNISVRDSDMKNLGYINIEQIEDKNAVFPELFRDKYFYENNKILDNKGNEYHNMSLWSTFNFFDIDLKMNVKWRFDIVKSVENFIKYLKPSKKLKGENYNHVAMEDYNRVAMKNCNHVAMEDCNHVAMKNCNRVAMKNYNHVAMEDYNHVAMKNCNRVAMKNYNHVVMEDYNHVAMENNCLAVGDYENTISIGYNTAVLMGYKSKVKGKIGGWISLIERNDDNKIIAIISKEIDGKEIKEDTYYTLENKQFVEVQ